MSGRQKLNGSVATSQSMKMMHYTCTPHADEQEARSLDQGRNLWWLTSRFKRFLCKSHVVNPGIILRKPLGLAILFTVLIGSSTISWADGQFTIYAVTKNGDVFGPPLTSAEQYCTQVVAPQNVPNQVRYEYVGANFEVSVYGSYSAATYCTYSYEYWGPPFGQPEGWFRGADLQIPLWRIDVICNHPVGPMRNWPNSYGYSDEYAPIDSNFCQQYFVSTQPVTQALCNACDQNSVGHPINPASGAVFDTMVDLPTNSSSPAFKRFYNSKDFGSANLNAGWRHTFSRTVTSKYTNLRYQPYAPLGLYGLKNADYSIDYADAASACVSGFVEIKSLVSAWANAQAMYANGVCSLTTSGGVGIGTLPIFYGSPTLPVSGNTVLGFDVTRDDGQLIRFTVINGVITAPPSINLKLQQTSGGLTLTDGNDNVEVYDTTGKLLSVTSRAGLVQTMNYDSSGKLSSVTDNFGHQLTLGYDAQNHLISVTRQ